LQKFFGSFFQKRTERKHFFLNKEAKTFGYLRGLLPDLLLVLTTIVWGGSFLATRRGIAHASPLIFVALRFGVAAMTIQLLTRPRMAKATRAEWRAGWMLGAGMLGIYGFQAFGMLTVESGRTAFISSLYVPLVPLLQLALLRRLPPAGVWIGIGVAFAGLVLLAGPQSGASAPRLGQALVLAAALCAACEILLIGHVAPHCDPRRLAVIECLIVAALSLALSRALGEPWPAAAAAWIVPGVALGLASSFLQIAVNWAQRTVPAARATLIYALEPVWAGLVGAWGGEHMDRMQIAGAALILLALVISARHRADA
jgi:drug/metabolite transporter (DMT)-like permease